mmetsp:Transcript_1249/g.1340  ORF Transcript_1249/g.1340 Transcript_1249/m.1340 type:complete len:91 (-) Transcript_1249:94-366(-)
MIKAARVKQSKCAFQDERVYLTPSPSDIIAYFLSERQRHIGVEAYSNTMFADKYQENERLRESLIMCAILEMINERGGMWLRELSRGGHD